MPAATLTPSRPLPGVWLVVALLHAALLALLASLGTWRDRSSPMPTLPALTVRLLQAFPTAGGSTQPVPETRLPPPRRPSATAPAPSTELQAITLPDAGLDPAPTSQPSEAPSPPASTHAPPSNPSALNLTLPRGASAPWRQRQPALDDPRANARPPVNMASLIERALGGDPHGPITEEALADGSIRFRRGRSCVIARPNWAQSLDPFNGSFSPKPRVLDSC